MSITRCPASNFWPPSLPGILGEKGVRRTPRAPAQGLPPLRTPLLANEQEEASDDIGGRDDAESSGEAEPVDQPADERTPCRADAEGDGEVEAKGGIAHLGAGRIGQICLQQRAFRIYGETH